MPVSYTHLDVYKRQVDSKAQNLSVCNAAETLLVHAGMASAFLPEAARLLREKGIALRLSLIHI